MTEAEAQSRVAKLVSRETLQQFGQIEIALKQWSKRFNLVAPASLAAFWARHVLDSVQLLALAPKTATNWMDLGSGAGFPGMILACQLAERPDAKMLLVEANGKKASFLQHCARITGAPVTVLQQRIEQIPQLTPAQKPDVITARALADLSTLLGFCQPLVHAKTVLLLPKGQNVTEELTLARKQWKLELRVAPSLTSDSASVLRIGAFSRV
ncbi:16S rRNA (guanine(527)-N(7))-methyltransferase [hydrothermal vent metagenome]|uniref:16S rRNA (Guanine(527)-N(7))-methyltransferase n=1 Tax=hydrothermal vent metagenome TaxID=652676 RepID=A0A3B0RYD6_9ZZZZ